MSILHFAKLIDFLNDNRTKTYDTILQKLNNFNQENFSIIQKLKDLIYNK